MQSATVAAAGAVVPRPDQIDWQALSPDGRWAIEHVAKPLLAGADLAAIVDATGLTRREIVEATERLKGELRSQATPTIGVTVSYVPLPVVIVATDLEAVRWAAAARARCLSLEGWLREAANREAA